MPSVRTVLLFLSNACLSGSLVSAPYALGQAPERSASPSGVAYTGTIWTTTTAPGIDGVPVVETHRLIVSQSSGGAIRRESFGTTAGTKHDLKASAGMIVLQDGSKQQTAILDPRTHIAEVRSAPKVVKPASVTTKIASTASGATEILGKATISGLQVTGSRRTYTAAAPPNTSSSTVVVTEDVWISPQLHTVIKSESHDTLNRSKVSIMDGIQQVEPEAATFSIPSNYTIHRK